MRDVIINEILIPALMRLYKKDYVNISDGVSERNICARLSLHLENIMRRYDSMHCSEQFKEYFADVEYDRMNHIYHKFYENEQHEAIPMISDLLIQSRGVDRNYLAVEMKRWKNYNKRGEDRNRIKALVSPVPQNNEMNCVYGTIVGAFIIYSKERVRIELYENRDGQGERTDELQFRYDIE